MRSIVNWLLVIGGGLMIIAEMVIGAATGLDLALLGVSLVAGGALGLFFGSAMVGLFSSGALALVYMLFLRRWIKSKLSAPGRASNVDALVGRTGVVVSRVAVNEPGRVNLDGEIWRAVLADPAARSECKPEHTVTVVGVEGVTLKVR